ncbi:hypothetical protein [Dyadobacter sp. 3J3]|uniref:hypothetical protein n=1 Tax=Dyadobacter sp. 3J3 TaxID=2606600 RepID=UPI001358E884|nr:hypothetical protein [Dyadobacter sp. 3J3]
MFDFLKKALGGSDNRMITKYSFLIEKLTVLRNPIIKTKSSHELVIESSGPTTWVTFNLKENQDGLKVDCKAYYGLQGIYERSWHFPNQKTQQQMYQEIEKFFLAVKDEMLGNSTAQSKFETGQSWNELKASALKKVLTQNDTIKRSAEFYADSASNLIFKEDYEGAIKEVNKGLEINTASVNGKLYYQRAQCNLSILNNKNAENDFLESMISSKAVKDFRFYTKTTISFTKLLYRTNQISKGLLCASQGQQALAHRSDDETLFHDEFELQYLMARLQFLEDDFDTSLLFLRQSEKSLKMWLAQDSDNFEHDHYLYLSGYEIQNGFSDLRDDLSPYEMD